MGEPVSTSIPFLFFSCWFVFLFSSSSTLSTFYRRLPIRVLLPVPIATWTRPHSTGSHFQRVLLITTRQTTVRSHSGHLASASSFLARHDSFFMAAPDSNWLLMTPTRQQLHIQQQQNSRSTDRNRMPRLKDAT